MKEISVKRNLFIFMLVFLLMPLFAAQQLKRLDRKYNVQYNRMYNRLSPAAKSQVARILRQFENRMIPLSRESEPKGTLNGVIRAAGSAGMDATMAAFIVMMKATKDMDDDISMIMAEIEAMTKAKQKLRDLIKELNQWISKEMASHPSSEEINNQPVSPSSTGHKSRMFKARKLFTPKYKVPYYKTPLLKRIPNLNRLPIAQLRRLFKVKSKKLKYMQGLLEDISLQLKIMMDRRGQFIQTLAICHKKILASQEQLIDNLK